MHDVGKADELEHAPNFRVPQATLGQLLQDRHVVDEREGAEVAVEAGLLRHVAEAAADGEATCRGARVVAEE